MAAKKKFTSYNKFLYGTLKEKAASRRPAAKEGEKRLIERTSFKSGKNSEGKQRHEELKERAKESKKTQKEIDKRFAAQEKENKALSDKISQYQKAGEKSKQESDDRTKNISDYFESREKASDARYTAAEKEAQETSQYFEGELARRDAQAQAVANEANVKRSTLELQLEEYMEEDRKNKLYRREDEEQENNLTGATPGYIDPAAEKEKVSPIQKEKVKSLLKSSDIYSGKIKNTLKIRDVISFANTDSTAVVTNVDNLRQGGNKVASRKIGAPAGGTDFIFKKKGKRVNRGSFFEDGKIVSIQRQGNGDMIHTSAGKAAGVMLYVKRPNGDILRYMHAPNEYFKNKEKYIGKEIKKGQEYDFTGGSGSGTDTKVMHTKIHGYIPDPSNPYPKIIPNNKRLAVDPMFS